MLPLGDNEAIQVLPAAEQLGTKLDFSGSLGTFSLDDFKKFGKSWFGGARTTDLRS